MWFLLSLLILSSCSSSDSIPITVFSGNEMTIDYRIQVGQPLDGADQEKISHIITDTFDEINQVYNKWNPHSELSRLNRLKALDKVEISPQLETLLTLTDRIVKLTEGKFDPTIEPLQEIWKKSLTVGTIPSLEEVEAIAPAIGWNKIHFGHGYFYKDHDLTSLDLGGIAKGYGVDLLTARLNEAGYKNIYVEWGGEIRAAGKHPGNRPWTIFISNLGDADPSHAIDIVALNDQAIATSGDYLQYWTLRDKEVTYFHILDPTTLQPLTITKDSIASVSVVAPTCAVADGLATALMMFPTVEEAEGWCETNVPDMSFWIEDRAIVPKVPNRRDLRDDSDRDKT
jgi:FAD:protein FMN transferase